ncbi:WD40 repeat domain-containing protein [Streptomyces sp. NPDC050548]|uniref:WD40 repeat domain-containing protein n=1 Tax=Streptomyces sp. NPDC050548 TaxID=3365629 RepID=UPI0037A3E8D4
MSQPRLSERGEPKTRASVAARTGHTLGITAVAFLSAGADRLATGDQQGHVRLWGFDRPPASAHTPVGSARRLRPLGKSAALHTRAVTALTTTRDYTVAASASGDGTVATWPTSNDQALPSHRLQAPGEDFTSAHLSPAGDRLWTTGSTAVRRWPTSVSAAEKALCDRLDDAHPDLRDQELVPDAREGFRCRT